MKTNAATGAWEQLKNMTVLESKEKRKPPEGEKEMLKVRISGPTYELKAYLEHMEKDKVYQVMSRSKPMKNKGAKNIFRVFTDVDKKTRIAAREKEEGKR